MCLNDGGYEIREVITPVLGSEPVATEEMNVRTPVLFYSTVMTKQILCALMWFKGPRTFDYQSGQIFSTIS
jgi:hypothetical protein